VQSDNLTTDLHGFTLLRSKSVESVKSVAFSASQVHRYLTLG